MSVNIVYILLNHFQYVNKKRFMRYVNTFFYKDSLVKMSEYVLLISLYTCNLYIFTCNTLHITSDTLTTQYKREFSCKIQLKSVCIAKCIKYYQV